MATRAERSDRQLNKKHADILAELLRDPGNKLCADCRRKDPRWASWNLGVFMCIRCSGIHRSLGTHISRVKSVDLDMWTQEQIESIQRWGNTVANVYWEGSLPSGQGPSEHSIENWIRSKYERRAFALKCPLPTPEELRAKLGLASIGPVGVVAKPEPRLANYIAGKTPKTNAAIQKNTTMASSSHDLLSLMDDPVPVVGTTMTSATAPASSLDAMFSANHVPATTRTQLRTDLLSSAAGASESSISLDALVGRRPASTPPGTRLAAATATATAIATGTSGNTAPALGASNDALKSYIMSLYATRQQ